MKRCILIMAFLIFIFFFFALFLYGSSSANISSLVTEENMHIVLPPQIYGVYGIEMNIYFDNIMICDDINDFQIDVNCSVGNQQNERWTWRPDKEGEFPLTISVYNGGVNKVAEVTTVIKISSPDNGAGKNLSCIFIGDSVTNNGQYTQELLQIQNKDSLKIALLGSRGTIPNLHEGRPGWKIKDYATRPSIDEIQNSFWNPQKQCFDFGYYMQQQGYSDIQCILLNLGINDVFGYKDDISLKKEIKNVLDNFYSIINGIHEYDKEIKIGVILTIPPSSDQDAFGANYGCSQTQWRYKRNNILLVEALESEFSNKENHNIYLVPVNVNLDTKNNMQSELVTANSRSKTLIYRQTNGVHPSVDGYNQMADAIWGWLKAIAGK